MTLPIVYEKDDYKIYAFKPNVFKLFYRNLEPLTMRKWVRFQLERMRGYVVYYLEVSGEIVGSCLVSSGGGRYSFADKKDIVIGPYFVCPEHRGHGYASVMVDAVLNHLGIKFEHAWDWIRKNNYPSIKTTENNGFERVYEADVVGFTRKIVLTDDGQGGWYIYKKKRG